MAESDFPTFVFSPCWARNSLLGPIPQQAQQGIPVAGIPCMLGRARNSLLGPPFCLLPAGPSREFRPQQGKTQKSENRSLAAGRGGRALQYCRTAER
eukprot:COSAG01_NODE_10980_length_2034_cov_22.196382_3_plen_97_part_00